MLPQRDVISRRQVLPARDGVIQPAGPLQHEKQRLRPERRQREAPAEGQEAASDHEEDRVEERPEKQEGREDQRAEELHAQPGKRERSATPPNISRSCDSSARRLARRFASSSITMTASKKPSTAGRSCASWPSAA